MISIMNTIRVSATKARNNFFSLLNQVALGTQIIIERDSKELAVLTPKEKGFDRKGLLKASIKLREVMSNYDPLDNPLRRKGAKNFLGQWDKGLKWRIKSS